MINYTFYKPIISIKFFIFLGFWRIRKFGQIVEAGKSIEIYKEIS